ncbi:methyltransferase domain-containing protein [Streptomyces sp. ISL-96]|uniref:methyltransferase domain-containing protein n=1 Tax=Streptomyces sp. ISL-96 TaxID=2819191 RepID=UPI00203508F7|nr:methyltransferase domain-containing protein [Streptomyces sp. ISL-96]
MTVIPANPSMGTLQEQGHDAGHDYAKGSPHIRHHSVRERVIAGVHAVVGDVIERNGACHVLELGAGHGTFTDHVVAAGADVEVTEMSMPSAMVLRSRFRNNPKVTVTFDRDGQADRNGGPLGAAVCISVLHHIPDYLETVKWLVERIQPGGGFFSIQDPLWYPRRSRTSMSLDRNAYLLWRLGQGEFRRGLATRMRRLRGVYDETNEADMVEYHVVRNGLDEQALCALLEPAFEKVELQRYWSTQSGLLQAVGDRFGPPNTFGILAQNRR